MPKSKGAVKRSAKADARVEVKEISKSGRKYLMGRGVVKFLIFILILALIVLVVFFLIEQELLRNPFEDYGKVEQKFSVVDECSLIVGNLIHQIDDDGICEARCKTQCQVREMDYVRFEFSEIEEDCNICDCYCK